VSVEMQMIVLSNIANLFLPNFQKLCL